jgi:hypothetical protein
LTLRVNQSLAKTAASVNYPSARLPRLTQIDAPFSSRLSRDSDNRNDLRRSTALLHNRISVDDQAIVDCNDAARRLHKESATLEREPRRLILGFQLWVKRVS